MFDNNSKFWRSLFALLLVQVDRCGGGGVRSAAPGDRMTVGVVNDWFLARVATISLVSVSTTTDDQLYKLVLNQSQGNFIFFVCILTTQSTFYVCYRVVIKNMPKKLFSFMFTNISWFLLSYYWAVTAKINSKLACLPNFIQHRPNILAIGNICLIYKNL